MTQTRGREVRISLPAAATSGSPEAAQSHTALAAKATHTSVTLPSGKVITLRRLSGLDSAELEQTMEEAGFTRLDGPGRGTYLRCAAAWSIQEIDGALQVPPKDGGALRMLLASMLEEDWGVLVGAYLKLAGMVPADSTF